MKILSRKIIVIGSLLIALSYSSIMPSSNIKYIDFIQGSGNLVISSADTQIRNQQVLTKQDILADNKFNLLNSISGIQSESTINNEVIDSHKAMSENTNNLQKNSPRINDQSVDSQSINRYSMDSQKMIQDAQKVKADKEKAEKNKADQDKADKYRVQAQKAGKARKQQQKDNAFKAETQRQNAIAVDKQREQRQKANIERAKRWAQVQKTKKQQQKANQLRIQKQKQMKINRQKEDANKIIQNIFKDTNFDNKITKITVQVQQQRIDFSNGQQINSIIYQNTKGYKGRVANYKYQNTFIPNKK